MDGVEQVRFRVYHTTFPVIILKTAHKPSKCVQFGLDPSIAKAPSMYHISAAQYQVPGGTVSDGLIHDERAYNT